MLLLFSHLALDAPPLHFYVLETVMNELEKYIIYIE